MTNDVYAVVKYTILCTGDKNVSTNEKFAHPGVLDFQGCWIFRIQGRGFDKGEGEIQGGRDPRRSYVLRHLK